MPAKNFAYLFGWFSTEKFLSHCPANQHSNSDIMNSYLCALYSQFLAMMEYLFCEGGSFVTLN